MPVPQGDPRTRDEISRQDALPRVEAVARRLGVPPGVRVEYALLHGDAAHEMLAFADERQIDLVAADAHGRSALGRLVMGSVSTTLVRAAQCWVLVAPRVDEVG